MDELDRILSTEHDVEPSSGFSADVMRAVSLAGTAPSPVIFYGSNQMHSARNVGKVPSRYYVIELRGDE